MKYVIKRLQYETEIRQIEIGGEEHLKAIQSSDWYLKKASDLRTRIIQDNYLDAEDRERLLKRIPDYKTQKEESWLNYFLVLLAGFGLGYIFKNSQNIEDEKFYDEVFESAKRKLSELLEG